MEYRAVLAYRKGRRPSRRRAATVIGAVALGLSAGGLLWVRAAARPVGNRRVPEPAKPVDMGKYLGRWFEFARYDARFERGCEGVTADYSGLAGGLIRLVNTCCEGSPEGRRRTATGRARVTPGSANAKLKVSFFGPFFVGNYWVLDHADDYSWSIVGEPSGRYLWILTRDPMVPSNAAATLAQRAADLGYDTTLLRYTRQSR
jgi:apolipoprotein D and lipocalin family protein